MSRIRTVVPVFLAFLFLAQATPLLACSTCFGRSDAPMAQGMNMGIFSLLGVIVSVLAGISVFFVYLARRAARVAAAAEGAAGPRGSQAPAEAEFVEESVS